MPPWPSRRTTKKSPSVRPTSASLPAPGGPLGAHGGPGWIASAIGGLTRPRYLQQAANGDFVAGRITISSIEDRPVRRKPQCLDRRVEFVDADGIPRLPLPQPDRVVVAAGDEVLTVRRERDRRDPRA